MKIEDISDEMVDKWAADVENMSDEEIENLDWKPGPYAWLLNVVPDWEVFSQHRNRVCNRGPNRCNNWSR